MVIRSLFGDYRESGERCFDYTAIAQKSTVGEKESSIVF
jgi:hypothetical protein